VRRALLARPMAAPELPLPPMLRRGGARRGRLAIGLAGAAAFGLLVVAMLPDLPAGRRGGRTAEARPDSTAITTAALGEIRTVAFAAGEDLAAEPAAPGGDSPAKTAPPATMPPSAAEPGEAATAPAVPRPGTPPANLAVPDLAAPNLAVTRAGRAAMPPPGPPQTAPAPAIAPPLTAPVLAPAAPPIVRPPPPPAARPAADPAMLLTLLRRGEALLAIGDVSGARRFFERAADAGSAAGALAAGRTYDPEVLAALGASGIRPDPMTASAWYHRARELEQQAPAHTETAR